MPYRVTISPAVNKLIGDLPRDVRARLAARLATLAANPRPHGSIKLKGQEAYRIRVGDYRIIYTIDDGKLIVIVIDVGNRRDVYRRR